MDGKRTFTAEDFDPYHIEPPEKERFDLKALLTYVAEANKAFGGEDLRPPERRN